MARYSINPDTEVYHESGANEMHRLSRKPPSDVALIENFPLIFNDPKTKPCTRRVQEYEQGPGFVKIRNVVSDHVVKFIRATFELDATSLFARSRIGFVDVVSRTWIRGRTVEEGDIRDSSNSCNYVTLLRPIQAPLLIFL